MRSIYLDYNATTPLAPSAQEAMVPYLTDRFADPLGEHLAGRVVAEAIEDARTHVATAIGAASDEIVWTSGATEASNLALRGLIESAAQSGEKPHLITSAIDHAAVQGPARFLARLGAELTVLPVDSEGLVDPAQVEHALKPSTRLVSVVHANEDLGSVQPIAQIAAICRREGVLVHTDAAQSFGKLPVDVRELDVDLLSLSAHKAYGPKGVGALYLRRGVGLQPQVWGDAYESGQRGGMPNVAGIVGFGAAAAVAAASLAEAPQRMQTLRSRMLDKLLAGAPDATVYGAPEDRRLANTLCVAMPGVSAPDLLAAIPELCATPLAGGTPTEGVSLGSALQAVGADPEKAAGAIRISVGWYTDEAEIDTAADALLGAWDQVR